jgi:hypothetical protein
MQKIRCSKLWSLPGLNNEKAELEREFPDDVPFGVAYSQLSDILEKDHTIRVAIEQTRESIRTIEYETNWGMIHNTEGAFDKQIEDGKRNLANHQVILENLQKKLLEG